VAAARLPIEVRGRYIGAGIMNLKLCQDGKIVIGVDGNYRATEQVEDGRRVLAGVGRDNGREALISESDYQALRRLWQ
jgi:hypothetical protein